MVIISDSRLLAPFMRSTNPPISRPTLNSSIDCTFTRSSNRSSACRRQRSRRPLHRRAWRSRPRRTGSATTTTKLSSTARNRTTAVSTSRLRGSWPEPIKRARGRWPATGRAVSRTAGPLGAICSAIIAPRVSRPQGCHPR